MLQCPRMTNKKQEEKKQNHLVVDAEEFTNVIRKLANSKPLPFANTKRRKNPETDPRYLPVFPQIKKKKD